MHVAGLPWQGLGVLCNVQHPGSRSRVASFTCMHKGAQMVS